MKISRALAARYAKALLKAAERAGKTEMYIEKLRVLSQLMDTNSSFREFVLDPTRRPGEIVEFVDEVLDLEENLKNFILLLLRKRRLAGLDVILSVLEGLFREEKGMVDVHVYLPRTIDEKERDKLKEEIHSILNKPLELHVHVDEELIGGLKLRIGDTIIDASVQGYLKKVEATIFGEG
ncbi:MAG: ATP synthase F1 subunit delta [Thermotogae bacterium]|nr:ATP synthase F1 subunit delta [Thermotogota bacterium]